MHGISSSSLNVQCCHHFNMNESIALIETRAWTNPYHKGPVNQGYCMKVIWAFRAIEWNIVWLAYRPVATSKLFSNPIHVQLSIQEIIAIWQFNFPYPFSETKGEPHKWQPIQIKSSAKLLSLSSIVLLLTNIFSLSESSSALQVIGRKISPIDALKIALQELLRPNTSESKSRFRDSLCFGNFQFLGFCHASCFSNYSNEHTTSQQYQYNLKA